MQRSLTVAVAMCLLLGCQPSGSDKTAEIGESIAKLDQATQELQAQNQGINRKLDEIAQAIKNVETSRELHERGQQIGLSIDKLAALVQENAATARALKQAIKAEKDGREEDEAKRSARRYSARSFERAERMIEAGRHFDAARLFQQLALGQPNTPHGREAAERIEEWGIDPDLLADEANRDKVNEILKKRRTAERTIDRAWGDLEHGRTKEGIEAMQLIAAQFPDSRIAEHAEDFLREHRVPKGKVIDATVKRVARAVAAGRLMERARHLAHIGMHVEALAAFHKLVKQHEGAPAAEEAREILMECGAWEVEITDANRDKIVARLKRMLREHGDDDEGEDEDD